MILKSLVLCSIILSCFTISKCSDIFLANDYSESKYECVTNSSFALSWINKEITETLDQVSTYIPTRAANSFDCKITKDWRTQNIFTPKEWSFQTDYQLIFDERWEQITAVKTESISDSISKNVPLNFENVLTTSPQNFNIPLSIRIEKEAHIFLCDGKRPWESNCYWFMLQAFGGQRSAIRKCTTGMIPNLHRKWPKDDSCKIERDNVTHPSFPYYLSSKRWSHFVLSKKGNMLTFSQIVDYKETVILQFADLKNPIDVGNVIIHSKSFNGLWKFHKVEYIYTKEETQEINLGPVFYPSEKTVCISMYLSMCSTCRITLILVYGKQVIEEKTYTAERSGWTMIKYITQIVQNGNGMQLLISTKGTNQDRFWAIDNVRLCQANEFRRIGLTEKVSSCQMMSDSTDIVYFDNSEVSETANENKCPEDTMGDFCVKCSWIFDNCERIKICTQDGCVCSAGYNGKNCYYQCRGLFYGHGCKKPCGKCYYDCNKIDGTCSLQFCNEGYSGPKCDTPPSIIFAKPPEIISISYTQATVRVENFNTENNLGTGEAPEAYTIQYKKAEDKTESWISAKETYRFTQNADFTITDLESDTQYLVRGVISTKTELQLGSHLKFSNFTTTCKEISDNSINIAPSNTSVILSLSQDTSVTCKSYTISIYDIKSPGFSNSSGTYFNNLTPYTNYKVTLKNNYHTITKNFMTTEGVPTQVQNLVALILSSSQIKLTWAKPECICGEFKHYIIEYEHILYTGCDPSTTTPTRNTPLKTEDTSIIVNDLRPYSLYKFYVSAANTKFVGLPRTQAANTPPSNQIHNEEIPEILEIKTSHVGANVELSTLDCEKMRGPLIVKVTSTCTSEWCVDQNRTPRSENRTFPTKIIVLKDLMPFSGYTVEIKFCRQDDMCDEPQTKRFSTNPTVPGPVRNLLIYIKNLTSISLRWDMPYPPTGILSKYKINYTVKKSYYSSTQKEEKVGITPCTLWPRMHCATLSNLEENKEYNIKISSRNEDPEEYGQAQNTETTTKIEKSKPPYDLNISWTTENEMKLEWKHPNETNGDIEYFRILLQKESTTIVNDQLTIDIYNLTYYHKINATAIIPTTNYYVSVLAFNGLYGEIVSNSTTSPPDIPTLEPETSLQSSNDTITITLSPKKIRGETENNHLILLRSDEGSNLQSYQELEKFNLKNMQIVFDCNVTKISEPFDIILGRSQQLSHCEPKFENSALRQATSYNITIILINSYRGETRDRVYSYIHTTQGEPLPSAVDSNLGLLALLLVIPLVALLYLKRHQIKRIFEGRKLANREDISLTQAYQDANEQSQQPKNIQSHESHGTTKCYSKNIQTENFENYVKTSLLNNELRHQHQTILESISVYQEVTDSLRLEYIDMIYLSGLQVKNAYAVVKTPKPHETNDFWKTIWDENIKHVVRFEHICTNNEDNYCPNEKEKLDFGNVTVECTSRKVYATFQQRKISLKCEGKSREINHFHFSLLTEDRVYLSSVNYVSFFEKISKIPHCSTSPILIHSCCGMKGTGFALLCDISLRMAKKDGSLDIVANLYKLSQHTPEMMIDYEHYVAAHVIILDTLLHLDTAINCEFIDLNKSVIFNETELQKQIKYIQDTLWLDVINTEEDPERNIYFKAVTRDHDKVLLEPYSFKNESFSYEKQFNVIKVDGFRQPGKFLVALGPIPETSSDFFTLVLNKRISLILSMNDDNISLLPTEDYPIKNLSTKLMLKHKTTKTLSSCLWIRVELTGKETCHTVDIFSMTNWRGKSLPKVSDFVNFCIESNEVVQKNDSAIVTCSDGKTACSLYVAMYLIIQKIKFEKNCDVCTSVRTVRRHCEHFVKDDKQYIFLLEAAHRYMKESALYEMR